MGFVFKIDDSSQIIVKYVGGLVFVVAAAFLSGWLLLMGKSVDFSEIDSKMVIHLYTEEGIQCVCAYLVFSKYEPF